MAASTDALEALDRTGPMTVEGVLVVMGDVVEVCSEFLHSPPACVDGLDVEGLDVASIPRLAKYGDRAWSWPPLVLDGAFHGGALTKGDDPANVPRRRDGGDGCPRRAA